MSCFQILSILMSYSLVFSTGCKKTRVNDSNVAETPTADSAYKNVRKDGDAKWNALIDDVKQAFRDMKVYENQPMVVVNTSKKSIRPATESEILGVSPIDSENEELFFGSSASRYLVSMEALSSSRQPGSGEPTLNFGFYSVDTSKIRRSGIVKKSDGVLVTLENVSNGQALRKEIAVKMRELNGFFSKPEIVTTLSGTRKKVNELRSEISSLEQQTYNGPPALQDNSLFLAFIIMYSVVAFGVSLVATNLIPKYSAMKVFLATLAVFIVLALVYLLGPDRVVSKRFHDGVKKIEDAKKRLEEYLNTTYGADGRKYIEDQKSFPTTP